MIGESAAVYERALWVSRASEAELRRKHAADFCMAAGTAVIMAGWITMMVWFTPTSTDRAAEYVSGLRTTLLCMTAFLTFLWWLVAQREKDFRHVRTRIEAEAYEAGFCVSGFMRHGFQVRS